MDKFNNFLKDANLEESVLPVINESQLHFSQIYMLLDYFKIIFKNDVAKRKREIHQLKKDSNKEIFKKFKNVKVKDFKNKLKNEPGLTLEWLRQCSIDISLIHNENLISLSKAFIPNLVWSSIYSISYGLFESYLNLFCIKLSEKSKIDFRSNAKNSNMLENVKCFLKDTLKFNFGNCKNWSEIQDYFLIRNFLLHRGGYLDASKKAERAKIFIANRIEIQLTDHNLLVVSKEFIEEFLLVASNFFTELEEQIKGANNVR